MAVIRSWKWTGLVLFYLIYHLNHNCRTAVVAIDSSNESNESESDVADESSFEQPRIWSSILEDLTIK